jgi:hypothetical protein
VTEEGFITVAEAAHALGLSERQARRRASVLEASGRTRTDGRTRLVTVADMMTARPDADKKTPSASVMASDDASGRTTGHDRMTDRTDIKNDRTDATGRPDGHDELVNQLRSELENVKQDREHWRGQAEKALQLVDQAQQLQLVAERKVAELEGKLLPSRGLTDGSQRSPEGAGGAIPLPESSEVQKADFWSFLRRWW